MRRTGGRGVGLLQPHPPRSGGLCADIASGDGGVEVIEEAELGLGDVQVRRPEGKRSEVRHGEPSVKDQTAQPAALFGDLFDAQGVLAGSKDAPACGNWDCEQESDLRYSAHDPPS
jgi:hypothetical protein